MVSSLITSTKGLGGQSLTVWQAYATGVALATPFLAKTSGWSLAFPFLLPWLLLTVIVRPRINVSLVGVLFLGLIAWHSLAQFIAPSEFASSTHRDSIKALILIAIASTVQERDRVIAGFSIFVLTTGLATALIGLLKLFLQDRGFLLAPILNWCPGQYPQGSNLCGDYNLLGLTWLCALAVLVADRLRSSKVISLVLMVPLIAAGLAVGSRRFLLLLPLLMILLPMLVWHLRSFSQAVLEGVKIAAVFGVSWVALSLIAAPEEFEKFRFGDQPYSVLLDFEATKNGSSAETGDPAGSLSVRSPNRAYPDVIMGTIDEGSLNSRIDRWRFGLATFAATPFLGNGFSYHEAFSERFVQGRFLDYPHLPLLSQALIGGLPLLLIGLAAYVVLSLSALSAMWTGQAVGVGIMFVLASAVAMISGDTMLSIVTWVTVSPTLAALLPGAGIPSLREFGAVRKAGLGDKRGGEETKVSLTGLDAAAKPRILNGVSTDGHPMQGRLRSDQMA